MTNIKKNAKLKQSTALADDVPFKELPSEAATTVANAANPVADSDAVRIYQFLLGLAIDQFSTGKSEEEVVAFLQNQGAQSDVALMVARGAPNNPNFSHQNVAKPNLQ